MDNLSSFLLVVHLVGLAMAVGAATVKLFLLMKCGRDTKFVSVYIQVARPITVPIIIGLILLTLSGIAWLMLGFPFTSLLAVKVAIVAAIWVLGPVIDNVIEPKFRKLAPMSGEPASPEFDRIRRRYLTLEAIATSLFYLTIVIWVWR